jgi:hypothetical protein
MCIAKAVASVARFAVAAFLPLLACSPAVVDHDDGFRATVLRGCRTDTECAGVVEAARARLSTCDLEAIRCADARADLALARRMQQLHVQSRAARRPECIAACVEQARPSVAVVR